MRVLSQDGEKFGDFTVFTIANNEAIVGHAPGVSKAITLGNYGDLSSAKRVLRGIIQRIKTMKTYYEMPATAPAEPVKTAPVMQVEVMDDGADFEPVDGLPDDEEE